MKVFAIGLSLLVLAGCDNKPKQPASKPAQQSTAAGAPVQPAAQATPPTDCPGLPANDAIATAIKAAMADTYGPDEAPADFLVTAVTANDCKHLSIAYHAKGNANAPQSTSASLDDDGQWFLMFYGKRYPIH